MNNTTKNRRGQSGCGVFQLISLAALAVMVCLAAWLLPSSAQKIVGNRAINTSDINMSLESGIAGMASSALRDVYELPKVYVLPVSCDPAPNPNDELFNVVMNADGKRIDSGTYIDDTIRVRVWKEEREDTIYNFAEIWIAHPTQLRTAFASGSYNAATSRETPLAIAQKSNAVVAINSDFCRYNSNGSVIIRGGQLYKHTPNDWDVLLVDSEGDFIFTNDKTEFVESNNEVRWNDHIIYSSFSFGPVLVRDGVPVTDYKDVLAAIHGTYLHGKSTVARSAIAQMGKLHYLLCTVDGTRDEHHGTTLPRLAQVLADMGCINAYNLDGGHSATLVFNDRLVNYPAAKDNSGTQRAQSDAIYFASAIPEE